MEQLSAREVLLMEGNGYIRGAFTKNGRPFRKLEVKEMLSSHETLSA
jgi:hypothetical protein